MRERRTPGSSPSSTTRSVPSTRTRRRAASARSNQGVPNPPGVGRRPMWPVAACSAAASTCSATDCRARRVRTSASGVGPVGTASSMQPTLGQLRPRRVSRFVRRRPTPSAVAGWHDRRQRTGGDHGRVAHRAGAADGQGGGVERGARPDARRRPMVDGIDLVIIRRGDEHSVLYGRCLHRGALLADGTRRRATTCCAACTAGTTASTPASAPTTTPRRWRSSPAGSTATTCSSTRDEVAAFLMRHPQPFDPDVYQGYYQRPAHGPRGAVRRPTSTSWRPTG